MSICGSTETKSGNPCGRPAGWGTDHVGEGCCRTHDEETVDESGLTQKQRRFVEEYTIDCNATQAAIRAGYSEKTAHAIGWENLNKPEIAEAIKQRLNRLSMTPEEALKRLTDMARATWYPFVKIYEQGRIWFNLGDEEAQKHFHLIRKIKSKRNVEHDDDRTWEVEWVEVELHDAKDAIDKILKAHGVYREQIDINVTEPIKIIDFGDRSTDSAGES